MLIGISRKWLPWKFVVRRIARSYGFIDPIAVLSRLHRFAQPSQIAEPIELLRAGVVFHARGLMNTKAIQHNLDWVWPYWVERQFDPRDLSFIPRAFSVTHVNLSHRNWTAVGIPGFEELPIVDPRGLLTPFWDSWSIDAWILGNAGAELIPSRADNVTQSVDYSEDFRVVTTAMTDGLNLQSEIGVRFREGEVHCEARYQAEAVTDAALVLSLRPYNPEGVSFIHELSYDSARKLWQLDDRHQVILGESPDEYYVSDYAQGDVHHIAKREKRGSLPQVRSLRCEVGMVTSASVFHLRAGESRTVSLSIPLGKFHPSRLGYGTTISERSLWRDALARAAQLQIPDVPMQQIYDIAVRSLILHTPHEAYPGPFTYRRFWFRDAAFIVRALLDLGLQTRAHQVISTFFKRQTRSGYFLSQEGEWDSNGQVLWILDRYYQLTREVPSEAMLQSIRKAAKWIIHKRLPTGSGCAGEGLFPPGFSAEHLGPSDYYYWDDFWGVAGLQAAGEILRRAGDRSLAESYQHESELFMQAIERSLERASSLVGSAAIPASPYRRMDTGAIGSIVAGYPLQLMPPRDPRLLATIDYFLNHCLVNNAFFQDMIHSGVNPYLTLHIAQVLLRAGEPKFFALMSEVAKLASPTGQWPEAIHPHTHGGCMGDGQHAWASAEWISMVRNCFVREEGNTLILASGIPNEWLQTNSMIVFGPTLTPFGPLTVRLQRDGVHIQVSWEASWLAERSPQLEVRLPGYESRFIEEGSGKQSVEFSP